MTGKQVEKAENLRQIDEKDIKILNILGENARTKLTVIAKQIGLSIDATKKRIQKLEKNKVIMRYTIEPDIWQLGLPLAAHVYIKLQNITKERFDELIKYLKNSVRVVDLISVLGDYDIYLVIIAKDQHELDEIKIEIRIKFKDLIADWREVLVTKVYKLEEYKF